MLTEAAIRAAKPAQKPVKHYDERGLYLLVAPTGGRLWRFRYRFEGKAQLLGLGLYPEVSLREARDRRDELRKQLAAGINPSAKRKSEQSSAENSFEAVALELMAILRKASVEGENPPEKAAEVLERTIQPHRRRRARRREPISAKTIDTMLGRLERHVFPYIGAREVQLLTGPELLEVLRRIESRGTFQLAHRVRSICSRVLRYARATGRQCEDVAADLIGLLTPVEPDHMATITEPVKIAELLRAIDAYHGQPITCLALKLLPYVWPRPVEFRTMRWSQLNLEGEAPDWRIPWKRMKMRAPHIVPLSRQAVAILRELHVLTSDKGPYVFPQPRTAERPMSENCVTCALRAMGFTGEEMSGHGFRALASTQLNELGWNDKWIEMQLAHSERNKSKKAYNHAKYLPQRRVMMQAWADHVDGLRALKTTCSLGEAEERAGAAAVATFRLPDPLEKLKKQPEWLPAKSEGPMDKPVSRSGVEHMNWCKRRALEYVEQGELAGALNSLAADLQAHAETAGNKTIELGVTMLMSGYLATPKKMRDFINLLR